MTRLRVLVVEDSLTVRRRLCEVLASDPAFEVVAEAADGRAAIERCLSRRPDVITMDMVLPIMSGLSAIEYIMAYCPTPILVVSSSFDRGEVVKTYEALAAGAVEAIEKPTGNEPEGAWEAQFLSLLRLVARVRVITHPRARLKRASFAPLDAREPGVPTRGAGFDLVAIGASTGGPGAVVEVLGGLGQGLHVPVIIVLHLSAAFAVDFACWLATRTGCPVAYARDGESLADLAGQVRLAPPGRHLVVLGRYLRLNDAQERHSCRPSVDVLFESVAANCGERAMGCLLTGMGRDGAEGLLRMRLAGALTIAQDEATSVVYGMPREAALLGAAERILPLSQIAPAMTAALRKKGGTA